MGAQAQPTPDAVLNSSAMLNMFSKLGFSTILPYVSLSTLPNCATSRHGGGTNIAVSQFGGAVNVPHVFSGSTIDGVAQSLHEQS